MNGPYLALTLVTGGRRYDDIPAIADTLLDTWHDATQDGHCGIEVMQGGATGADAIAKRWALEHAADGVGHQQINADWDVCAADCPTGHRQTRGDYSWCPTAGHRRNQAMVDAGPAIVLAFPDPKRPSTGTRNCMRLARAAGIPVREVTA